MSTRIPNTRSVVSYAYTVKANGVVIGTLQNFSTTANRRLERVRELMNEEIDTFEIVPGRTDFTITLGRLETYDKQMMKALGYTTFEDLSKITDPITIVEEMRSNVGKVRKIEYQNCWVSSWSKTIAEGTVTVTENVSLDVERIRVSETV